LVVNDIISVLILGGFFGLSVGLVWLMDSLMEEPS
jgi:hypothetical protein